MTSLGLHLGGSDVLWAYGQNPARRNTSVTRNNDAYASTTTYNVSSNYALIGLNQHSTVGSATFGYDTTDIAQKICAIAPWDRPDIPWLLPRVRFSAEFGR